MGAGAKVMHLSEVLRAPVVTPSGEAVGRVDDVIVRLRGVSAYPRVSGIVAAVGDRRVFVGGKSIQCYEPERVRLAKSKVDLRQFERRLGEVLLRADVLGYRLIDVAAGELVRAYDVELEDTPDGWVLARVDTRRPPRLFGLLKAPGGHAARDWKAFEPLIGHGQSMAVRRVFGRVGALKPAQIADLLEEADRAESGEILERVRHDPELEADVFEELDPGKASRLLDDMPDGEVAALLGRMRADDAADTVVDLRQSRRRRVLELMPAPQRAKVITLLGFHPDSAGGLMSLDFVSCGSAATAGEALALIAGAHALQPEALLQMHVLNERGQLAGTVPVIALLQADPADGVARLMDSDPIRVRPEADLTDVAVLMSDYNLHLIPVVDERDTVLGVVTIDDVLDFSVPDDWRRREPGPRPTRDAGGPLATRDLTAQHGQGGE
ncbi:magnesium transporter MgtE N-terminal domain-containing protein [Mycobacterium sp. SM1]|uniref:magnesium transporter MgtE N-terminal domain-containing protein n=1 Tax=Mycobacterium sp. SM1 TaxID=2816243 RepID=UPI001F36DB7E|nr:CBS domain-containing protein [Mycobacterium sp. SM1]